MNAILGWARMLGAKQLPPDRAEKAVASIERSASALAHMIDAGRSTTYVVINAPR